MKEALRRLLSPKLFNRLVQLKNSIIPAKSYLQSREQHRKSLEFYRQFVRPGDLVFDVGANFGVKTKIFLALGARTISIEPQELCTKYMRSMFGNRTKIVQKGVGSEIGELQLHIAENSTLSSFSSDWIENVTSKRNEPRQWKSVSTVPITTIDQLIHEHGIPSFIKIDVEGFETQVLQGLTQKVNYLSFEYAVPENIEGVRACVQIVSGLGNCSFNYSQGESMQLAMPNWLSCEDFVSLIGSNTFLESSCGDIYVRF